jgi:hypothetical protein
VKLDPKCSSALSFNMYDGHARACVCVCVCLCVCVDVSCMADKVVCCTANIRTSLFGWWFTTHILFATHRTNHKCFICILICNVYFKPHIFKI